MMQKGKCAQVFKCPNKEKYAKIKISMLERYGSIAKLLYGYDHKILLIRYIYYC